MKPLDSKTISGQIINKVIDKIDNKSEKLNLFPDDYIPTNTAYCVSKFMSDHPKDSIFVLLGKQVQSYLDGKLPNSINVHHPAYNCYKGNSKEAIEKYVADIVQLIKAITAYSVVACMLLFVLYVWYYILRAAYVWIRDELVPAVFGNDDDHRWD